MIGDFEEVLEGGNGPRVLIMRLEAAFGLGSQICERHAELLPFAHVTIERMRDDAPRVPLEIATEAGELISDLASRGWRVYGSQFDAEAFGNWSVDLRQGSRTLRLVKDRSQFMVTGPPAQEMKDAGLWQAFESLERFRDAIKRWADRDIAKSP